MSSQITNSPKVFISYSWDSPEHKDRVLELSDRLVDEGIDCILDQYVVSPSEGWPRWMERQIREADFVLIICTETYLRRVLGEESPGKGHGVRWEGHLTYQDLYDAGMLNTKFIPVLLESGKFEHIPKPLRGSTVYPAHTEEGYKALYGHLTNQQSTPRGPVGKLRQLAPRERQQNFSEGTSGSEPEPEKKGQDWEKIVAHNANQLTTTLVPGSAYTEETWVGREELIDQLNQRLRSLCRVLVITGIPGIGKTALAERLARELLGDWSEYRRVEFDYDNQMPDFTSIADYLLTQLNEVVTADDRREPERLLNRLLQKLRENRYLVQMDSLEVLLEGKEDEKTARNDFQDEWWLKFFQRLLAGQDCQSRLILTSQDLPTQFLEFKNRDFWTEKPLSGLKEVERFKLFQKLFRRDGKEVEPESEAAGYLERISKVYEGHPLVLRVIAGEILSRRFQGNVVAYWRKYRQEFEEIEQAIRKRGQDEALQDFSLASYNQELQRQVNKKVKDALERLGQDVPVAYKLLCRSSVYRRPVPEKFWLVMLGNLSESQKEAALSTLDYRYLVEWEETRSHRILIRQHNLIRSVAHELLRGGGQA